ncbi:MAG: hypothetical protein IJ928_05845 [Prevotella sp.]|nr:hypothetical protein [Prevotella sp.]
MQLPKRFQNKIAESRRILPLMVVYALAVWVAAELVSRQLYVQLACFAVCAYLMVELNNSNSLIRIYSRMVSCSFLALTSMSTFLFPSFRAALVTLCFISFYTILFHTYQDRQSPGFTFYAFFALGIASVMFPQVVFFVIPLWLMMAFWLMALTPRMFFASLLGLVAPYWFIVPYYFYVGLQHRFIPHAHSIITFRPLFPHPLPNLHLLLSFAFVLILGIVGTVHFLRQSSKDKIRTRMLFSVIITMFWLTTLFIILQPQHFETLFGFMTVNASVLIGHFIALTHTRFTNFAFKLMIIAVLALTAYNLWMPS